MTTRMLRTPEPTAFRCGTVGREVQGKPGGRPGRGREVTRTRFGRPALAVGAAALGALAIGALSIGALAVGRLVVGRLLVRKSSVGELEIRTLSIGRLDVQTREGGAES